MRRKSLSGTVSIPEVTDYYVEVFRIISVFLFINWLNVARLINRVTDETFVDHPLSHISLLKTNFRYSYFNLFYLVLRAYS